VRGRKKREEEEKERRRRERKREDDGREEERGKVRREGEDRVCGDTHTRLFSPIPSLSSLHSPFCL